jgi:hypothetical protein
MEPLPEPLILEVLSIEAGNITVAPLMLVKVLLHPPGH